MTVVAHNLISTAFKNHFKSRNMLSIKRSQYVNQLVTEFNDDIQVEEYLTFNSRLVKDVLIYHVSSEASNKIKRKTISMLFSDSLSQRTAAASLILFEIISSTIITFNTLSDWSLKDFKLNCRSKQIISRRLICKLKVAQIAQSQSNKELKLTDLRVEMLWDFLQTHHLVSNQKYEQLTYDFKDERSFNIFNNEDLQNAIHHYCAQDLRSMMIIMMTFNDFN